MSKAKQTVELAWVNDGAPTTLGSIPVKGEQRLENLRAEGAAIVSADMNAWLTHLRACLCMAKRVIAQEGVEAAHHQWNIAYGSVYENLAWDADTFEASLDLALQDYVFIPLGTKTLDESEAALRKQAKESNAVTREFRGQRLEWLRDQHLEEVFWLFWRAVPRPDFMPSDKKVPSEADISASKDIISYFLDDEEYGKIIASVRGAGAMKANLEALSKTFTTEMVQKKAQTISKP